MSKIGRLAIKIPEGVSLETNGAILTVSGPKGTLTKVLPKGIEIQIKDGQVYLRPKDPSLSGSIYGTSRALVANMVRGVKEGWIKELELVGTGFRAEVSGNTLILTVGYSHPVKIEAPEGITFRVEKTQVTVEGVDRELVGKVAAEIRKARPPEPYKGKGIRYKEEVIRKKVGKAAKTEGVIA